MFLDDIKIIKNRPMLVMEQVEGYIEEFIDIIYGVRLKKTHHVFNELLFKIKVRIPNDKQIIYNFYGDKECALKCNKIIIHEIIWNKIKDIEKLRNNSEIRKNIRIHGFNKEIPTIDSKFYEISNIDMFCARELDNTIFNMIENNNRSDNQVYIELCKYCINGYIEKGGWISGRKFSSLHEIISVLLTKEINVKEIEAVEVG